jgi:predicted  nucleic acid-binding Zn-ribbon protein
MTDAAMTDPMEQLLVVQGHDLRGTQLRTRRQSLPERAEAEQVAAAHQAVVAELAAVDAERHRLEREQARLDDEVAGLKDKSAHADKALYGGAVTGTRELQALQEEIASLGRRISDLEDTELELMVERDPLDEQAAALGGQRDALAAQAEELLRRITVAEAEIDAEIESEAAARATAAESVPADLLADYETLRSKRAGIGVAKLEHGTCQGCHMQLSAMELDRIKALPPDARITCEDCGRLLVR